jgi:hypothetical protein
MRRVAGGGAVSEPDPYLERIDDRINWRLTHCNLPVADLRYLINTIDALQAKLERYKAIVEAARVLRQCMDDPMCFGEQRCEDDLVAAVDALAALDTKEPEQSS